MALEPAIHEDKVKEGSITSSHTINNTYTKVIKRDGIVTVTFQITLTSQVAAWGVIGTIESGFRPPARMYGYSSSGHSIGFQDGGGIQIMSGAATPLGTVISTSATYINTGN